MIPDAAGTPTGTALVWRGRIREACSEPVVLGVAFLVSAALLLIAMQMAVLLLSALKEGLLLDPGGPTLANLRTVLSSPDFVAVAWNTGILGVGSTTVMLAWAIPFVWLYTRTDLPGKRLFLFLLTVKIAIPSFLIALAYIFLLNPSSGILNRTIMNLFGLAAAPINVYSMPWIAFLQGTALATPAFFMMAPAFSAMDASLEEAAYASGLDQARTLFGVVLPLMRPAVVATAIYYLILSMEIFDYAGLLGLPARIMVFSTWIYQLVNPPVGAPRYGEAAIIGALMAVLGGLLVLFYLRALRRADRFAVVTGKRGAQPPTRLGRRGTWIAWAAIGAFALLQFVLPILILVWASLLPYIQPPSLAALDALTLSGYRQALAELPPLLQNTLFLAFVVPTLSVAAAACISWVVVRTKFAGRHLVEVLVMASIGIPSVVGALAFLYFGLSTFRFVPLYTSIWLIVMALAVRYVTWGTRTINSSMVQLHAELEEACAASGVGPGRGFLSVVLPLVRPALIFSWFWIALLTLRELTIPVFLVRRDTQVLATAIWGFNAAGASSVAAALGVILLLIIGVMVLLFQMISLRKAR